MDKIAANNHFVVLKKEIKKAKAMVCGNLIRKINNHKKEKEKVEDDAKLLKLDNKIDAILKETKLIKTLDSYAIAKQATLKPDSKHWDRVIGDSKASAEERLIARVISKNNVLKQVNKFREDHKDCDEWINEYIEYREKKREIKECTSSSNKTKKLDKKTNSKTPKNTKRVPTHSKKLDGQIKKAKSFSKDFEGKGTQGTEDTNKANAAEDSKSIHPSWECKRKEKELLKAAISGKIKGSHRIKFDDH